MTQLDDIAYQLSNHIISVAIGGPILLPVVTPRGVLIYYNTWSCFGTGCFAIYNCALAVTY